MTDLSASLFELDPVVRRDALRALAPTQRTVALPEGAWMLRWEDVRALLRDRRLAGVGLAVFDALGITDGPLRRWYGSLMFTNEGEAHHRLRALVQQAFVPRSIEALRPVTRAIADEALAPIAAAGEGDLMDLASTVPIRSMAKLVGVERDDLDAFARRVRTRLHASSPSWRPRRSPRRRRPSRSCSPSRGRCSRRAEPSPVTI